MDVRAQVERCVEHLPPGRRRRVVEARRELTNATLAEADLTAPWSGPQSDAVACLACLPEGPDHDAALAMMRAALLPPAAMAAWLDSQGVTGGSPRSWWLSARRAAA